MTATVDNENDIISEALEIIDRGLGQLLHRELVSTAEAADLLLDVRSLLATANQDAGESTPAVPVGN